MAQMNNKTKVFDPQLDMHNLRKDVEQLLKRVAELERISVFKATPYGDIPDVAPYNKPYCPTVAPDIWLNGSSSCCSNKRKKSVTTLCISADIPATQDAAGFSALSYTDVTS